MTDIADQAAPDTADAADAPQDFGDGDFGLDAALAAFAGENEGEEAAPAEAPAAASPPAKEEPPAEDPATVQARAIAAETEKLRQAAASHADGKKLAAERAELEKIRADLDARLATMDGFADDPMAALSKFSKKDPLDLIEEINKQLIAGKVPGKPDPMKDMAAKIEALQAQLKERDEQAVTADTARQVETLRSGIETLVGADETPYPTLAAFGATGYAQLATDQIVEHYNTTGELLDARKVLADAEEGMLTDLKQLLEAPRVRQLLGLAETPAAPAGQQQLPPSISSRTPSLTNAVDGTTVTPVDDDDLDEDEIIARAVRAYEAAN